MMDWIEQFDARLVHLTAHLLLALAVAILARWVVLPLLVRGAKRTITDLDDQLVERLRRPLMASILLIGLGSGLSWMEAGTLRFVVYGVISTLAVIMWSIVLAACGVLVLTALSRRGRIIQIKTLPLFTMVWKVIVYGLAAYFLLAAWHINLTTWLASAGVAGIAVGFAAKDTLANLFAGVFIIADAPFKIGDYIVIDNDLRGRVTEIGLRSSRIVTRDEVEVTVPNAVIGNAKIVNETGGPTKHMRIRVKVNVAYDSDVDLVRRTLMSSVEGVAHLVSDPEPRVRFRTLGDSGLLFELLAWIEEPALRGRVLDQLNEKALLGLRDAGVEIPFPQVDLHVRQMPK